MQGLRKTNQTSFFSTFRVIRIMLTCAHGRIFSSAGEPNMQDHASNDVGTPRWLCEDAVVGEGTLL